MMRRLLRYAAGVVAVLVVCAPAAFLVTFLLSPLWSRIETTYGIESIGHSGPADWCFELMYLLFVTLGMAVYWRIVKRSD